MAVLNFEAMTEGQAATTANSGFDEVVSAGTGGSITGLAAAALNGTRGIRFTSGTTAACIGGTTLTAATQYTERIPFKVPSSPPTQDTAIWRIYQGSTVAAQIIMKTTYEIQIQATIGNTTAQLVSAANMSSYVGQYVAVSVQVDSGSTTSNGSFLARFYATPFDAAGSHLYSASQTAWNMGSGASFTRFRLGFNQPQTAVRVLDYDYVEYVANSTTWLGPVPAASAPGITTAVSDQYPAVGATVTLTATETGVFTSATWSCVEQPPGSPSPSISDPSAAVATVLLAERGHYIFRRRLAWSGGNQDSLITVWVHAIPGQRVGLYLTNGTWTNEGGAASRLVAYTDGLPTTFGKSGDNPNGTDIEKIVYNPMDLGPIKIYTMDQWAGGIGTKVDYTLLKEDEVTVIDSWTYNPDGVMNNRVPLEVDGTGLALIPTRDQRRALVLKISPAV